MAGTVEAIFTAPKEGGPIARAEAVDAVAGSGIAGDRYYDDDGLPAGRQLTLIQAEHLDELSDRLAPGAHRRQIVTRGIDLNALVGRTFTVGAVRVRGIELCPPCDYLGSLTYADIVRDLADRGGLNAQILTGGPIVVGDLVAGDD